VPNNSADEIQSLKSAISSVGASSGVDPRFILAIVMQESGGCVRAPTTNGGVRNPGLMQTHDGTGTCNDPAFGGVQTPCPASAITQMIKDGTNGTPEGDGLKQVLQQAGTDDASKFYIAARIYNSGSVDPSGNLGLGGATHCYSTDVANRLLGWSSGLTSCQPAAIGAAAVVDAVFSGIANLIPTPTPAPGGVFAQLPAPAAPAPTPSTITTTALPTTTTVVVFDATTSPAVVAQPSPTPAAVSITGATGTTGSTTSDVSPADVAPVAPAPVVPAPVVPAALAPITGTGSTLIAGSACTTEGEWNCINATSFQQCGSGIWSAVQELAAGTQCVSGQSAAIDITSLPSKKRHLGHFEQAHVMKHARHAKL
jgi:hypothetical protein